MTHCHSLSTHIITNYFKWLVSVYHWYPGNAGNTEEFPGRLKNLIRLNQLNSNGVMGEGKPTTASLSWVRTSARPTETPQRHEGTLLSLTQRRADRDRVKSLSVFWHNSKAFVSVRHEIHEFIMAGAPDWGVRGVNSATHNNKRAPFRTTGVRRG